MRIVAILQQRTGSSRLPGKALLPLAGKSMTENIIERVQRAKRLDAVVLAVPPRDEETFQSMPCRVYAPLCDEDDLVTRYLVTAQRTRADIVVRISCDNPCIEPQCIEDAIKVYLDHPHIFLSNAERSFVRGKWIDGLGCEVMSFSRWQWLDRITLGSKEYREHPHKYFWENNLGPVTPLDGPADIRLDVNTQDDYEGIKGIYDFFGHNRFSIGEVMDYLQGTAM